MKTAALVLGFLLGGAGLFLVMAISEPFGSMSHVNAIGAIFLALSVFLIWYGRTRR
jgi:hypothetical protein